MYESEVTVRDIKLYRFTAPDEVYRSGDVYAPNKGFCVPPDHPHCLPSGLLDVSRCQPQSEWYVDFQYLHVLLITVKFQYEAFLTPHLFLFERRKNST